MLRGASPAPIEKKPFEQEPLGVPFDPEKHISRFIRTLQRAESRGDPQEVAESADTLRQFVGMTAKDRVEDGEPRQAVAIIERATAVLGPDGGLTPEEREIVLVLRDAQRRREILTVEVGPEYLPILGKLARARLRREPRLTPQEAIRFAYDDIKEERKRAAQQIVLVTDIRGVTYLVNPSQLRRLASEARGA